MTTATTNEKDHVLVLHAPDGAEWARFLAARLATPAYNINSTIIDITTDIPDSSAPSFPAPPPPSSSSPSSSPAPSQHTTEFKDDGEDAVYTNELLEDESLYTNNITINNNNNNNNNTATNNSRHGTNSSDSNKLTVLSQSIDESRVCAIFISPEIIESKEFCVDVDSLNQRRTVFLLLGVEYEEVIEYFGDVYGRVSKCRWCFIHGTEETIREGIVSIIEAYEDDEEEYGDEDDEDVYKVPNQPVQRNTIEKVFPRMLTETEREVYVLLSRIPEDAVHVDLVDNDIKLPLKSVSEKLFSFVLPQNIYGEVNFQLECQGRRFGEESVQSFSKLDLIQNILESELNPHSLIASSLGLDKDDIGELDTALAMKLEQLAPVMTFKALCPCEEALKNTEEQSNKMWPTILHFAAELNLRLLCSQLLNYPGMAAAACTENRAGEFPSQIANRKGFFKLENDLIEFMKRLRREVDPDYVSSSQCDSMSSKDSSTTNLSETSGPTVANDDSSVYLNMGESQRLRKPLLGVTRRSLTGHSPSRTPVRSQSDRSEVNRGRVGNSQRPLPKRPDSPVDGSKEETYSNPDDSPGSAQGSPTSQKALKRLGVTEEEVASRFSVVDPKIGIANVYSATCPPGTLRSRLFEEEGDRASFSSNCDIPSLMSWNSNTADSKRGQLKEKVKGFFHKIKKSSSSKPRRGSEPMSAMKSRIKNNHKSHSFDEERDSGSYSDEEKKQRVFVRRNKPMARRVSRRIEFAKKESYGPDAPELPALEKRATFKSFVQ